MKFILGIIGYIAKNVGLILGLIEQIIKILAGIAHLTPSRKDDEWVNKIERIFDKLQALIYKLTDRK